MSNPKQEPAAPAPGTDPNWSVRQVPLEDTDAVRLRADMATELGARYADREDLRQARADQQNPAGVILPETVIATIVLTGADGLAYGHGILRWLEDEPEIKRVYIAPSARGRGAAAVLMRALEDAAETTGARRVRLSTGDRQPDAVRLYSKLGYRRIPLFGPYVAFPWSICFEKPFPSSVA